MARRTQLQTPVDLPLHWRTQIVILREASFSGPSMDALPESIGCGGGNWPTGSRDKFERPTAIAAAVLKVGDFLRSRPALHP